MANGSSSEDDAAPLAAGASGAELISPVVQRTTVDDSDEEEDQDASDNDSESSESGSGESTSSDEERRPAGRGGLKKSEKTTKPQGADHDKAEAASVPNKAAGHKAASAEGEKPSKDNSSKKAKGASPKLDHGDKVDVAKKKKKEAPVSAGGTKSSPSHREESLGKDHPVGASASVAHSSGGSPPPKKKPHHDGPKGLKKEKTTTKSGGDEKDEVVGKKRTRESGEPTAKKKKASVEGQEASKPPKASKGSEPSLKPKASGEGKREKNVSGEPSVKKKKKAEGKPEAEGEKESIPASSDQPAKLEVKEEPRKSPPRPTAAKKQAAKPKKKRRVSKEEEKEIKKALKTELKKRQNDAAKRVANHFKQEARLAGPVGPVHVDDSRLALSSDLPPAPCSSVLDIIPSDQVHRLISVWSFLYSFSRPLGLLRLPSLKEVCDQYKALTPPTAAAPSNGALDIDQGLEGVPDPQEVHQEAVYWWEEIAYTLVRSILPDLEQLLGVRGVGDLQGLFNGKKSPLLIPFNALTWREIARQGLLTAILRELNFTDKDIADCIRGQGNFRKARSCLKLLKLRVEAVKRTELDEADEEAQGGADPFILDFPDDGCATEKAPMNVDYSFAPTPAPAPMLLLPEPIPTISADTPSAAEASKDREEEGRSPVTKGERVSDPSMRRDDAVIKEADPLQGSLEGGSPGETRDDDDGNRDGKAGREGEGDGEGVAEEGQDEDQDDAGADDEEEEEDDEGEMELFKELQDLLSSSDRSEEEKRLGMVMKRLLLHQCSALVGPEGTQDQEVESTLADYPMAVWRPVSLSNLVGRLCMGDFAEDTVRRFTIEVDQLCRNTWTCNVEDSEPWLAAEKFSAMYDRLVKTWILDSDRPDLECLTAEETCAVCRKELEKQQVFDRVTCGRCSLTLHKHCLKNILPDLEDGWFCNDCISLRLRRDLLQTTGIVSAHQNPALEEEAAAYGREVIDFCNRVRTVLTDWGPRSSFPPPLDATVNQSAWEFVKQDQEMFSMVSGLALLVTSESSWGPGERMAVLEALCHMAFSSQAVKTYLEKQEQKVHALRRKVPDDDAVFCDELKRVGGDVAALAWKDPLLEVDMPVNGPVAETEPEEDAGPEAGFCCICKETTADFADDRVVLCEECEAEVHLTCIDKNLTAVPEKDWFCPKCKAKRNKRRVKPALKLEDLFEDTTEAARNKAEHELFEDLVDERCEQIFEAQKASEAGAGSNDGTTSVPSNGASAGEGSAGAGKAKKAKAKKDAAAEKKPRGPACAYCGFAEMELGSPFVYGQSRLETEEHIRIFASKQEKETDLGKGKGKAKPKKRIKVYLEDKEVDMPVPPLPFFPRATSPGDGRPLSLPSQLPRSLEYPVVHERCAVEMVKLRAKSLCEEVETSGAKDDKEKAVEEALRVSGSRGCPLGEDRHHRSYWRFAGDDKRLLVWIPDDARDLPKTSSSNTTSSMVLPAEIVHRGHMTKQGHWLCYEEEEDVKKLVEYLEPRSSKEGPLRAAIVQSLLEGRKVVRRGLDETQVIRKTPVVVEEAGSVSMEDGEGQEAMKPKEAQEGERMDVEDAPAGEPTAQEDGGAQTSGEASEEAVASGAIVNGREAPPGSVTHPPRKEGAISAGDVTEKTGVDGAQGPTEEKAAAGDEDAKGATTSGAEDTEGKKEKPVPVALKISEEWSQELLPEVIDLDVDNDTWGEDLEEKDPVKFTRKGYWAVALMDKQDELWRGNAEVIFEVLRGMDIVDSSKTNKPHKDGFYYFKSHEFRLPGIYTLKFSVGDPFHKQIRPILQRVEVRGRRVLPSVRSALNTLSFLNVSRGGRYSHRHQQEIDIPDDVDDVGALRITLLQLKDGLPQGAFIDSPDDLGPQLKDSLGLRVSPPGVWTEELEAKWVDHLMNAKTAKEVLEDLILLETFIHPEFIKPWYLPLKRTYASSPMHMLRLSTVSITALHLFVLDKAIHYDKERKPNRKRPGRGQESEVGRSTRGSQAAGMEAQKPFKRNSRTSRAAADMYSEEDEADDGGDEDYEGEEEEDDDDDEVYGDEDDEDYRPRGKRRKSQRSGGSKKRQKAGRMYASDDDDDEDRRRSSRRSSNGRSSRQPSHFLRTGTRKTYAEVDSDDDFEGGNEEDDGAPARGWQCPACTFLNRDDELKCQECYQRRPASTRGAHKATQPAPSHSHPKRPTLFEDEEVSGEEEVDFGTAGNDFRSVCTKVVEQLRTHPMAGDFLKRVPDDIPNYYSVIKKPMWLDKVYNKVQESIYKNSYEAFATDLKLIWDNCELYNGEGTQIVEFSRTLRDLTDRLLAPYLRDIRT